MGVMIDILFAEELRLILRFVTSCNISRDSLYEISSHIAYYVSETLEYGVFFLSKFNYFVRFTSLTFVLFNKDSFIRFNIRFSKSTFVLFQTAVVF